jgi:hypothetical protein
MPKGKLNGKVGQVSQESKNNSGFHAKPPGRKEEKEESK